jgi:hypothetical protein
MQPSIELLPALLAPIDDPLLPCVPMPEVPGLVVPDCEPDAPVVLP